MGDPVDDLEATDGRCGAVEAEQRDDPVDIDQQERAVGVDRL